MKNVLIVSACNVALSGVPIFLRDWLGAVSKQGYRITWYCCGIVENRSMYEQFLKDGVSIVVGNASSSSRVVKYLKMIKDLRRLFQERTFDIIDTHTGAMGVQFIAMEEAVNAAIPVRIVHSHNAPPDSKNVLKRILMNWMRRYIVKYATQYVACGEAAGKWLFGLKVLQSEKWMIVKNKIDVSRFCYNETIRGKYRDQLGIHEEYLLGNVGTYSEVKNQLFLLDVMSILKERGIRVKLLLIGEDGPMKSKILEQIKAKNLEGAVIAAGRSAFVNHWLQAMDAFLMPSKYEGFGIAALEAQASGLPCYLSDRIPADVRVMSNVYSLSIDSAKAWADAICEGIPQQIDRSVGATAVRKAGFDLENGYDKEVRLLY